MSPALNLGSRFFGTCCEHRNENQHEVKGEGGKCVCVCVCMFNMLTDRTAVCAVHDMVMAMGGGGVVFPKMLPSHSVSETKQKKNI